MANRLGEILANKRAEVAALDLAALRHAAQDAPPPRDFAAAVRGAFRPAAAGRPPTSSRGGVRLIAELKRASPSRGPLAVHLDLAQVAQLYAANGAAALSVLTDEKYFLGNLATLRQLRYAHNLPVPLLRKDFILAPAQLHETRAAGADAVLLIAAALPEADELADLHALALELGLAPLVEVHTAAEVERVLPLPGLKLLGINNRNLATFDVDLQTTAALRGLVPAEVTVVSESGIFTPAHMAWLAALGVDAALVGEALVTAPDIAAQVRALARP